MTVLSRAAALALAGVGLTYDTALGALPITTDTTQNGGTLAANPPGELIVSGSIHPGGPTLQLINGATTSGVQGLIIGTTQTPLGNNGALSIQSGSILSNTGSGTGGTYDGITITQGNGYVGLNTFAIGAVTVTGIGSSWTNTNDAYIGYAGTGSLSILGGGSVSDTQGAIGVLSTSTGTATVSGAGSIWANSTNLAVGGDGAGTLTINSGGVVTAAQGFIGSNTDGAGQVSVTGTGSSLKLTGDLNIGFLGIGTLNIGAGGLVQTGGITFVNTAGSGINLSGGTLQTGGLGLFGVASRLNWTGGTINITNSNQSIGAGGDLGPSLTVDTGKTLEFTGPATQSLSVVGTGALNISGGYVAVRNLSLASPSNLAFTSGTLEVNGGSLTQSSLAVVGGASAGQNATFKLTHGATYTTPGLYIGNQYGVVNTAGTGAVSIESGSTLTGFVEASNGTVTVTGNGSKLNGNLTVGEIGNTTANITAGATVSGDSVGVGFGNANGAGTGTLNIAGTGSSVTANSLTIGAWDLTSTTGTSAGTSGTVNVQAGATLTVNSVGYVGYTADGTLNVQSGAQFTSSSNMYVGFLGTGTANIAGNATFSGDLNVGSTHGTGKLSFAGSTASTNYIQIDNGTLDISAGSTVTSRVLPPSTALRPSIIAGPPLAAVVGYDAGTSGTVTVRDPGTSWTIDELFIIGYNGSGALTISNGAHVIDAGGLPFFGQSSSGAGIGPGSSATVTDAGSRWSVEGGLGVGIDHGIGTLLIEKGGAVSSATGAVNNGTATIVDAGSNWTTQMFGLTASISSISIHDGGQLNVAETTQISTVGAKINLGPGGTFTTNTLFLSGDPTGLNWTGGTLKLTGGTTDTGLNIPSGGSLQGSGTIGGNVVNAGSFAPQVFSPAAGPGPMTVNGTLSGAGEYVMLLASPTSFDQIQTTGSITFNGSTIVVAELGFTPTAGETFELFKSPTGAVGGTWGFDFTDAPLPTGLTWDTSTFATTGGIGVIAVPEPATGVLMLAGMLSLLRRRSVDRSQ